MLTFANKLRTKSRAVADGYGIISASIWYHKNNIGKHFFYLLVLEEMSGITKVIRIHPLGAMNVLK